MALTPCRVARAPLDAVRTLLDANPALRQAFWWLMAVENAMANEWTVTLGRRSALERLAHLLCELQLRLSTPGAPLLESYPMPIRQQEIGDALGLSIVHLNRQFYSLKQEGLASLDDRRLTILNREALVELSDFEPAYLHLEGLPKSEGPASALRA